MEWRVVRLCPGYEVSSTGLVRRIKNQRLLKPKVTPQGYHEVALSQNGQRVYLRVHRLVCEAFNGPAPTGKPFALHRDDVPDHNVPENLRWGTRLENAGDALRNDRYLRGENCGSARHSEETVRAMIADHEANGSPLDALVAKHGISRSQTAKILSGQYWKHL